MSHPHEGHRRRMRERFLVNGFDGFQEHEIVELLLFYGIPRVNTNNIAHELITRFGDLAGVFDADIEDIRKVKGVTENAAVLLKMIPLLAEKYAVAKELQDDEAASLDRITNILKASFLAATEEKFILVCLDCNFKMIDMEEFDFTSGKDHINIEPVDILRYAIQSKADLVIFSHNHTGSSPSPSSDDIHTTTELYKKLKMVGIKLYDHLIFSPSAMHSMRKSGAWGLMDY